MSGFIGSSTSAWAGERLAGVRRASIRRSSASRATSLAEPSPIFQFNKAIIDATADLVCAYKPQFAHYAAYEAEDQLERTIEYIHRTYPAIPVILDAKRGDVGNTAERYAIEAFERYGADAVTVNPYLGSDSLEPFLRHADRGVIVLCRTSNPGAGDLQDLEVGGRRLYQVVAQLAAERWNTPRQLPAGGRAPPTRASSPRCARWSATCRCWCRAWARRAAMWRRRCSTARRATAPASSSAPRAASSTPPPAPTSPQPRALRHADAARADQRQPARAGHEGVDRLALLAVLAGRGAPGRAAGGARQLLAHRRTCARPSASSWCAAADRTLTRSIRRRRAASRRRACCATCARDSPRSTSTRRGARGRAQWSVSADGRTYTFNLRPEARWSNGDPVVAADFVAALRTPGGPGHGFRLRAVHRRHRQRHRHRRRQEAARDARRRRAR